MLCLGSVSRAHAARPRLREPGGGDDGDVPEGRPDTDGSRFPATHLTDDFEIRLAHFVRRATASDAAMDGAKTPIRKPTAKQRADVASVRSDRDGSAGRPEPGRVSQR